MEMTDEKTNYMIVASCNPYHARFHNNGGIALERDNGTVVKWTFEHWRNLSLDEARRELESMVSLENSDAIHYEDDQSISELYEGETPDWYVGPGYYENEARIFDPEKDLGYNFDTMSYRIEEMPN